MNVTQIVKDRFEVYARYPDVAHCVPLRWAMEDYDRAEEALTRSAWELRTLADGIDEALAKGMSLAVYTNTAASSVSLHAEARSQAAQRIVYLLADLGIDLDETD
jgi:hypothetical protein